VTPLLFASLFLVLLEMEEFKKTTQNDLSTLATVIGNRTTAALTFHNVDLANENLAAFNTRPEVRAACLYDVQGVLFAQLIKKSQSSSLSACPDTVKNSRSVFKNEHLSIVQPIVTHSEPLGTLSLHADVSSAYWHKIKFILLLCCVFVGVSLATFLLSTPLLTLISLPIKQLLGTVKSICDSENYSLRAVKINNDELGVLVDAFNELISTVERQNRALTRAKDRYLTLYDDNPTMVFNLNNKGTILSVNRTGAKQLGLAVDSLEARSILDFVHPGDLSVINTLIENCLARPFLAHKYEIRQVCHNGRIIWVRATAQLIENECQIRSLLLVCEDVTETHELNEKIAYQASHDALTGLANRSEFDLSINKAIALAQTDNSEHALCYLDLDQFKIVNDTCGHCAGDELLKQLTDLLKKHLRQHDFIARLGGDEFGVLMYNCSLNQAVSACEKLREIIQDFRFAWEGRSFSIGVSIGVAFINNVTGNAGNLLKEADAACYAAKDNGRNRVHVFRPDDQELAMRHGEMQWVEKIRQGLQDDLFCLYGQMITSLSGQEEGLHFETLVRYQENHGPLIPPGAFLPAAERYNLAVAMDRWVIGHTFKWLADHPAFLEQLSLCAINLSGLSLSDETMLVFISEQFSEWAIPQHKICFEITETAAIANLSHATKFISQLRAEGCLFSLDDFGSGLSSFAYLKNLPVDFLKIDGLFVKDILDDKVDLAMVKSINEIGHIMGKKTVAEFVENQEIFELLKELGIDYAQGFGIAKPIPLDDLELLARRYYR
jgi:diguanylate cyclase (GGDEF)-like protein/PAS domain S-box-containing protein